MRNKHLLGRLTTRRLSCERNLKGCIKTSDFLELTKHATQLLLRRSSRSMRVFRLRCTDNHLADTAFGELSILLLFIVGPRVGKRIDVNSNPMEYCG